MPEVKNTDQKVLTFDEKVNLFKATASFPKARAEYAKSRATVILPLLDVDSHIRSIFTVENLPLGAEPRYDIPFDDINCAWVMPKIGGIPQIQVEGTEIYVSTFEIDAAIQYQMRIAEQGRFQVGERSTRLLKNKIVELEELAGFTLIQNHAAVLPAGQKATSGVLDVGCFNDIVTKGDVLRRKITDLFVSPTRYSNLRNWVVNTAYSNNLKDQAFNLSGLSNVWDVNIHKVYDSRLVANNKGYAFGQRDGFTYGVMPIRRNLETYDNPIAIMEWKIGIMAREEIGFGVLDDKALIETTFTA
jgi:hypothetical protein